VFEFILTFGNPAGWKNIVVVGLRNSPGKYREILCVGVRKRARIGWKIRGNFISITTSPSARQEAESAKTHPPKPTTNKKPKTIARY
jgi:hypothetical protein